MAFADLTPFGPTLTKYDEDHAVTYVRMLDAEAVCADWREVSRIVLRIDPDRESDRARRAYRILRIEKALKSERVRHSVSLIEWNP